MVKPGINQRVLQIEKTVKYYTYCHCDYPKEDKYHDKFPDIRTSSSSGVSQIDKGKMTTVGQSNRQKSNSGSNTSASRENSSQATFFAILSEQECFMAQSNLTHMKLSSV